LDLPYSTKYSILNTKDYIYKTNKAILTQLINAVRENNLLRSKTIYVTHFKTINLYNIWERLDQELCINKFIQNRAIGGLVGLRGATRKEFSPFIGSAFICFYNYYRGNKYENKFRLHFLGVYLPHDRFCIALLERLFKRYLAGISNIVHTYDTYRIEKEGRNNWADYYYFWNSSDSLIKYSDIAKVPLSIIDELYNRNNYIFYELERLKRCEKRLEHSAFAPINFHSNQCIDEYFEYIIDKHQFIDIMMKSSIDAAFIIKEILNTYSTEYPELISSCFIENTVNSVEIILSFHKWFMEKRDRNSLNTMMINFIKRIGFKEILT
jgi:hypothetical protein